MLTGKTKAQLQDAMEAHFLDGIDPSLLDAAAKAQIVAKARAMGGVIADWVSGLTVRTTISLDSAGLQTTTAAGSPTGPPLVPVVLSGSVEVGE